MQNSNIQVNNFMGEERKPAVDVALKKPVILSGNMLETNQQFARARLSSNNRAGPTLLGATSLENRKNATN
jgi:hypothetical protein